MKTYSLISENDGKIFYLDECEGLIQSNSMEYVFSPGFLVEFHGISSESVGMHIPLNEVFRLVKIVNSKAVEVGYIQCDKLLSSTAEKQVYLTSLLDIDIQKICILECFLSDARIRFNDLNRSYAKPWLSACCIYHFEFGNNIFVPSEVELNVNSLRSKEEFYCHLGEILFGYRGYAGQDLDGCSEILKSQKTTEKFTISVRDVKKVREFLAKVTGHFDYYEKFKKMIEGVGGEVIASV